MTQIVQLDYNDLQTIIKKCLHDSIEEIKKLPKPESLPDQISFDEARIELGTKEKPVSKAQLYKLTALKKVPHRKFGKHLIFSRKEIASWKDHCMVSSPSLEDNAIKHLQKEAVRHLDKVNR